MPKKRGATVWHAHWWNHFTQIQSDEFAQCNAISTMHLDTATTQTGDHRSAPELNSSAGFGTHRARHTEVAEEMGGQLFSLQSKLRSLTLKE